MGYVSKGFWNGVAALKSGIFQRTVMPKDGGFIGEPIKGAYVSLPGYDHCLCAVGVLINCSSKDLTYRISIKKTDGTMLFLDDLPKEARFINKTNVPLSIFLAAESLFEGWYSKLKDKNRKWTHEEVGAWLEKVGQGIDRKHARASEFNCQPFQAKNWFIKPDGVNTYMEVEPLNVA